MVGKLRPAKLFHPPRQAFNVNGVTSQRKNLFCSLSKFEARIHVVNISAALNQN